MTGISRLLFLAALAVIAFAAALLSFEQDARRGCAVQAEPHPSYDAELVNTPTTKEVVYRLYVTRGGEPVTGARVCLRAEMEGMSAMGVNDQAVEVGPGSYEVEVHFDRAGTWEATVVVSDGGDDPVAVPLSLEVTDRAPSPARPALSERE